MIKNYEEEGLFDAPDLGAFQTSNYATAPITAGAFFLAACEGSFLD
jgi:hypothetical protein